MMWFVVMLLLLSSMGLAACQPAEGPAVPPATVDATPSASVEHDTAAVLSAAAAPLPDTVLQRLARPRASETVCDRFARRVAEFALQHPGDSGAFLRALQQEFVGGTDDPFELEKGLRTGKWNQDYFYSGHGGFRPELDDAAQYPRGGNHQPGHFISVLSIAARFGEENARAAIAYAGDYEANGDDDLRLSEQAIRMGTGLSDASVTPAEVARRVQAFCR
jgi:hypothetical protein